jgi:dihydroxyacetone kinase
MGIHGEPGVSRGPIRPADEVADELMEHVLTDLQPAPGSPLAVLVNGLGATPKEELYIVYRRVHTRLAERGHRVHRLYLGEFATSLEMAGASISLLELDDELARWIDAPADSPFFLQV